MDAQAAAAAARAIPITAKIEHIFCEVVHALQKGQLPAFKRLDYRFPNGVPHPTNPAVHIAVERLHKPATASFLQQLVLLEEVYGNYQRSIHSNIRAVYYKHKAVFKQMSSLLTAIHNVMDLLDCTRDELRLQASHRGIVFGNLSLLFDDEGSIVRVNGSSPIDAKWSQREFKLQQNAHVDVKYILVVEKETVFNLLVQNSFFNSGTFIIITGRGQPDDATKAFLNRLTTQVRVPVLGIADYNPHGVQILFTYKFGASSRARQVRQLATPQLKWLGLHHSALGHVRTHATDANIEPWSSKDQALFDGLTERLAATATTNPDAAVWLAELQRVGQGRVKFDLEALAHNGMSLAGFVERKVLRREWL